MRSLISYIALVVLPILGLAGILRAGARLKAPTPVHGTWRLATEARATEGCGVGGSHLFVQAMVMQQSGRLLSATLGGSRPVTLTGEMEGDSLHLAGDLPAEPAGASEPCDHGPELVLDLVVTSDTTLAGFGRVAGCRGCPTFAITAQRDVATAAGGRP